MKKAELDDVIRLVQNLEGQLQNMQFQLDSVKLENVRLREKVDKLEQINSNSGSNQFSNQNNNNAANRNHKRVFLFYFFFKII